MRNSDIADLISVVQPSEGEPENAGVDTGLGSLNATQISEIIKQHIKMVLLTAPGERIFLPRFGVGLRRYLFELPSRNLVSEIKARSSEQLNIYVPSIKIRNIQISFKDGFMYYKLEYYLDVTKAFESLTLVLPT